MYFLMHTDNRSRNVYIQKYDCYVKFIKKFIRETNLNK